MPGLIKICGLREPASAEAACAAGATHLGFVFYPKSPRYIEAHEAASIAAVMRSEIKIVALVVDPAEALIGEIMDRARPDAVQFHGAEGADALARIKDKWDGRIEVWKALGMASAEDMRQAEAFDGIADRLLFDARPPRGADRPGGHGAAFDWSILGAYEGRTPWLLAGGLSPENVAAAIDAARAIPGFDGVDVSSGVERAPGEKDGEAIARFAAAAQAAFKKDAPR
ncbi:MAG: phosphoribosylanthranilate isomerase [Pseudomonadota bacterium]